LRRVLTPAEQRCMTEDAQALIYKYSSRQWLSPSQLEDLITEVVIVSTLRQFRADADLVNAILEHLGDPAPLAIAPEAPSSQHAPSHLPS
jgi:hypothetical protein